MQIGRSGEHPVAVAVRSGAGHWSEADEMLLVMLDHGRVEMRTGPRCERCVFTGLSLVRCEDHQNVVYAATQLKLV